MLGEQQMNDGTPTEEDPYERGFAYKLYENEPEPESAYTAGGRYHADASEPYAVSASQSKDRKQFDSARDDTLSRNTWEPEEKQMHSTERKPKKSFLRRLLKLLLVLLLIFALVLGAMLILAKQPVSVVSLGERKSGCATILLAGTDESGDRTDTLMLLSVNRAERRISVMSIPRDTKVDSTYSPHKINGAYGINGKGTQGMDVLMDYVSECVGFHPDRYMLIDLDAFIEVVDLMGGVEFDVPCDMNYDDPSQDLSIHLTAGKQTLNGEQAMGLVRFRSGYSMADLERVRVQREFISAAMDQWISVKNLWKMPAAAAAIKSKTLTDLSARNLVWLAESIAICGTERVEMMTIPHYMSSNGMYVMIDPNEILDVVNEYFNPYEREITRDDLNLAVE